MNGTTAVAPWGIWCRSPLRPDGVWACCPVSPEHLDTAVVFRSEAEAKEAATDMWTRLQPLTDTTFEARRFDWDLQPRPEDIRR